LATHISVERPGTLLLIGGAEDDTGPRTILRRFVALSGADEAHIGIIAAASGYQHVVGRRYMQLFSALGAAEVELIEITTRAQAQQPEPLAQLDRCSGVFMAGGDQLKLTAMLGGTVVAERIRRRHQSGLVVAGTSAGASAAAEHMLAYGYSGVTPRQTMMQFAPGLGLIHGVVVDQHFGARSRTGRLITALAHNPGLLGIGLDEDTAAEITSDGELRVLGSGSVMIIDAREVNVNDIYHVPYYAPFSISGLNVHILADGARFDLQSRTTLATPGRSTASDIQGMAGEGI
jgi:cyanophycinase